MFFQPHYAARYDEIYTDDEGNYYIGDGNGELAGIKSFFKKVGKIALPIAGVALNAIPGIGTAASIAINAGLSAGGSLLEGGGGGGVAKGLAGITAFGQRVIAELDALKNQITSESGTQADQLLAALSDSSKVYQPKKGKDAAALASFKTQATQKVSEIKALAVQAAENERRQQMQMQQQGNVQGGVQPVMLPNGQIVYQQMGGGDGGLDTTKILMFAAIGLGAILILKK